MKTIRIAAAVSLAFAAGQVGAQQDGDLSATESQADSVVTIIKENAVRISNVDDIDFEDGAIVGALNDANDAESDDVCVFSSTGNYQIAVASANDNSFELREANNAATAAIPYVVSWIELDGTSTVGTETAIGGDGVTVDTNLTFAGNDTDDLCATAAAGETAGNNARFTVTLDQDAFNAADPATYTDTLTLTVTPG